MKNAGYFYAAYALVLGGVLLYSVWLGSRLRSLEQRLLRVTKGH